MNCRISAQRMCVVPEWSADCSRELDGNVASRANCTRPQLILYEEDLARCAFGFQAHPVLSKDETSDQDRASRFEEKNRRALAGLSEASAVPHLFPRPPPGTSNIVALGSQSLWANRVPSSYNGSTTFSRSTIRRLSSVAPARPTAKLSTPSMVRTSSSQRTDACNLTCLPCCASFRRRHTYEPSKGERAVGVRVSRQLQSPAKRVQSTQN